RLDVERIDRKDVASQLLVRPGVLRQHDYPVRLIDERAFFRNEVQSVIDRIDQQHVEVPQGGNRLALALGHLEPDRLPFRRAELAVDPRRSLPNLAQVAYVRANVLPRRLEKRPELDLAAQLGVVAQKLLV